MLPLRDRSERASGLGFLFEPVGRAIFTPESFTSEERALYRLAADFTRNEVLPHARRIEDKDYELALGLVRRAAALGFLSASLPPELGGLGLGKVAAHLVFEASSQLGSWIQLFATTGGIGMNPIVYFGTPEQRARYVPRLASGEWIGAYALSEAESGSDALAARTTAVLSPDGQHYLLNGSKQWITNAAFADVFTVFAKIDGTAFTAFLVDKGTPGLTVGREEHKLGMRGSSTCPLIFEDARVPVGNVLGEVGKGHKIALNILNLGRLGLAGCTIGASKRALATGVRYALARRQFGKPIADFGLIKKKIADAVAAIYASESMFYRTAHLIDEATGGGHDAMKAAEEYTAEASMVKVHATEAVGRICDEMLQLHGGNGFTEDYDIERDYRDARVCRIYEGTNEINRLIIPAVLYRRALKGQLPLLQAGEQLDRELAEPSRLPAFEGPLAAEQGAAERVKRMFVLAARAAALTFGPAIEERQHVLAALADVATEAFAIDTVCQRTRQAGPGDETRLAATRLYVMEARDRAHRQARSALCSTYTGEALARALASLGLLDEPLGHDAAALHDVLARAAGEHQGYPFPYVDA